MWEIESQEVDKAEGVHRFSMIERGVTTRDGEPARYKFVVGLGTGHDGQSCHACGQKVEHKHTLHADGGLRHADGTELVPRDEAKKKLAELNDFHARMDAHARRHRAKIYAGPGK